MATVNEYVVLSQPDKLVLLAEIPATDSCDSSQPTATFRLLVEQCYDYGNGPEDVDTVEDVTSRVPLRDLGCQGAVDRAFGELVAGIDNPMLRPEVAPEAKAAAARVLARCGDRDADDELRGMVFRLRVMFIDAFDDSASTEDDESGSDMEFGEFDLHGARHPTVMDYEDDDDDDSFGGQFSARPYYGALVREGGPSDGTLLLSGFETRSDGPQLTEQHELTSWDMHRLVRLALDGGSMDDDEAYQRALAGGTPVSRASSAAMLDQALQSARHQQQSKSPSRAFRMRTGF